MLNVAFESLRLLGVRLDHVKRVSTVRVIRPDPVWYLGMNLFCSCLVMFSASWTLLCLSKLCVSIYRIHQYFPFPLAINISIYRHTYIYISSPHSFCPLSFVPPCICRTAASCSQITSPVLDLLYSDHLGFYPCLCVSNSKVWTSQAVNNQGASHPSTVDLNWNAVPWTGAFLFSAASSAMAGHDSLAQVVSEQKRVQYMPSLLHIHSGTTRLAPLVQHVSRYNRTHPTPPPPCSSS